MKLLTTCHKSFVRFLTNVFERVSCILCTLVRLHILCVDFLWCAIILLPLTLVLLMDFHYTKLCRGHDTTLTLYYYSGLVYMHLFCVES